jgi:DNA-binding response OmpR family regulator
VAPFAPTDAGFGDFARRGALGDRERAVLAVLVEHHGRVVDRSSLRHRAGLDELSPRRCDALLVRVRAALGDDAIVTVRRRGWMLRSESIVLAAAIIGSMPG